MTMISRHKATFPAWLQSCAVIDPQADEAVAVLFSSWKRWAESNDAFIGSIKQFTLNLVELGYERYHTAKVRKIVGLKLARPPAKE